MHALNLILQLVLCVYAATSVAAFCPPPHAIRPSRMHFELQLVTEADVIALVEKAEDLWAQVEQLRNEANDLSIKAETMGQDAETSTADAMKSLEGSISVGKLADANEAQNMSIDLGNLLERAMEATKKADEMEVLAEEALAASEAALEQHLIDFPENDQ